MRLSLNVFFSLGIVGAITAQIPKVPSKLDFAGMKLSIAESARKEIQQDVDRLHASEKFFQLKLDLINLYFPLIEETLIDNDVPEEFKYLTVQESGLVSDAVSSAKAVGFWQFKDFTGREVGLRIDNRIDERKNVVASTRGAAKYLKRNNFFFDNWVYALTAYYAGAGGAKRYTDESNYGVNRMTIDKRTHWYVKRFLAHYIAYKDFVGGSHSEGLELDTYTKGEGKTLDEIARNFKVEPEFLRYYNKWIKSGKIPDDREYAVIIPLKNKKQKNIAQRQQDQSGDRERRIEEPDAEIKETPKVYPNKMIADIGSGVRIRINGVEAIVAGNQDDINSLAAEAGISVKSLRKYNDMSENQTVEGGTLYYIKKKKSSSEIGFHVALANETPWSVSQRYGLKLKKLQKNNRMTSDEKIEVGRVMWLNAVRPKDIPIEYHDEDQGNETLVISKPMRIVEEPRNDEEVVAEETLGEEPVPIREISDEGHDEASNRIVAMVGKTHIVVAGETLWSLSRKYETTVEEIRAWNDLTKYDVLDIGQEIFVEEPREKKQKTPKTKTYVVRAGDTLYRIANEHGMGVTELMELNGKSSGSISIGEELKVFAR
ncbi:MAG: LysM peptidoglycan-binding domain-containing protein [Cyclobacteriaceae bacterium]